MPNFYDSLLTTCNDQIFRLIKNGIIDWTITICILVRSMAEHRLQMNEAAHGLVALVFSCIGILENLIDIKFIKIWTLNRIFAIFILNYALESIFFWCRTTIRSWSYLLLFFLSIFLEASILILSLTSINHFLFHFFKKIFHLLGRATFFICVINLCVGAILLLILF